MSVTEESITDPVLRALLQDLRRPALLAAADDGRYGVHAFNYPVVLAWVAVGNGRLGLRIDCVDYPTQAPAARPWDLATGVALPVRSWPVGTREPQVFRPDWSPSYGDAPYLACDRLALQGHPDWPKVMPERSWNPARKFDFYLEQIYIALRGSRLP